MRPFFTAACSLLCLGFLACGQKISPALKATGEIGGKKLSIQYGAPSVKGRDIFSSHGLISHETNYPVWRAGADPATILHTDANLEIGGLSVPKGNYSLYVLVKDPDAWQLIINKLTGQWGLEYDQSQDLGRVKMSMSKPSVLIEQLKYTISGTGANTGKIQMEWEHHIASVAVVAR